MNQSELKELLTYNPLTGVFTWLQRDKKIGGRVAGKEAGAMSTNVNKRSKYRVIAIKGIRLRSSRLAVLYMTGILPKFVKHLDENLLNDKYENLEPCGKKPVYLVDKPTIDVSRSLVERLDNLWHITA